MYMHCNSQWRKRLREKSFNSLLFTLKFVMSGCELGTIAGLFENGEIPKTRSCIQAAYEIIESQGCLNSAIAKDICREMTLFKGK